MLRYRVNADFIRRRLGDPFARAAALQGGECITNSHKRDVNESGLQESSSHMRRNATFSPARGS
jgi:hypothetical protein